MNSWFLGERDSQGLWGDHVHTAKFKMDNQQKSIVWCMECRSMLCASLDGRGFGGRMDTCIWLSPFTVHLKLSQLLIGYTPIQNVFGVLKKN